MSATLAGSAESVCASSHAPGAPERQARERKPLGRGVEVPLRGTSNLRTASRAVCVPEPEHGWRPVFVCRRNVSNRRGAHGGCMTARDDRAVTTHVLSAYLRDHKAP